jgi:phytoene dehydrogenase-like protein
MKVTIIGAGVSGLSVGCYLQMNGFDTEIYERHAHPGGLCTSWKRGNYVFDGCIHWLLGSNKSSPFYRLWSELIDMPSLVFVNHHVRVDVELAVNQDRFGDKVFHLYTDINRLESYLIGIAPEDETQIKSLIQSMRLMQRFEMPPMIDNIPALQTWREKMAMINYLPIVWHYLKWKNVTNFSFARKLKNPFLKEAFELLFDGDELKLLILTMPLSIFDKQGAGYPVGGSLKFASHLVQKYQSLGGRIHYNKPVKHIITDGASAKGILLNDGTNVFADITISAADWHFTVFEALKGRFVNKKILALASNKCLEVYPSITLISLGVSKTFKDYPHLFRFPMTNPLISPDGTEFSRLEIHIYNYDPTLAPEGKAVIAISLYTRNGDYWINLRNKNYEVYVRCKNEFAETIIDRLEQKIPGIRHSIEVMDIATPATYHRYTNNWKGSIQGWMPGKDLLSSSPIDSKLPGLADFYFCSHWSVPGGGLPVAIKTGRDLAQNICLKNNKFFHIR